MAVSSVMGMALIETCILEKAKLEKVKPRVEVRQGVTDDRWSTGNFEDSETILYATITVDTSNYRFIKNYKTYMKSKL